MLQQLAAYNSELTAFFANIGASTQATLGSAGLHYLRTMNPLNPLSLAPLPNRHKSNRTNAYTLPRAFADSLQGLPSFETRACATGSGPSPDLAPVGTVPDTAWYTDTIRTNLRQFALGDNPANVPAPACKQQGR